MCTPYSLAVFYCTSIQYSPGNMLPILKMLLYYDYLSVNLTKTTYRLSKDVTVPRSKAVIYTIPAALMTTCELVELEEFNVIADQSLAAHARKNFKPTPSTEEAKLSSGYLICRWSRSRLHLHRITKTSSRNHT